MDRFVHYNPNPDQNIVDDCTIRAICKATGDDWDTTFAGLSATGFFLKGMPSSNYVWGAYLRKKGYRRYIVDDHGEDRYTVRDFCQDNPAGTYILALNGHVVCVVDGEYYDTWDSGNEIPVYYWRKADGTPSDME